MRLDELLLRLQSIQEDSELVEALFKDNEWGKARLVALQVYERLEILENEIDLVNQIVRISKNIDNKGGHILTYLKALKEGW